MATARRRGASRRTASAARASGEPVNDAGGRARPMAERAPRSGAKRTVIYYMKQLPRFLKLLFGLLTDRRVATIDKLLVGAAIAYIAAPIDLIPDFLPFIGEVDDVFLLVLALQRLIENAGRLVLLDHWSGDAADLADLNLRHALAAAAFFLPKRIRRRLRVIGRS